MSIFKIAGDRGAERRPQHASAAREGFESVSDGPHGEPHDSASAGGMIGGVDSRRAEKEAMQQRRRAVVLWRAKTGDRRTTNLRNDSGRPARSYEVRNCWLTPAPDNGHIKGRFIATAED